MGDGRVLCVVDVGGTTGGTRIEARQKYNRNSVLPTPFFKAPSSSDSSHGVTFHCCFHTNHTPALPLFRTGCCFACAVADCKGSLGVVHLVLPIMCSKVWNKCRAAARVTVGGWLVLDSLEVS